MRRLTHDSGRSCCILMQVISSLIKFHNEKIRIRFALFGDEWLYIKIQASPFSSCIEEVCWLLRLWLELWCALMSTEMKFNPMSQTKCAVITQRWSSQWEEKNLGHACAGAPGPQ